MDFPRWRLHNVANRAERGRRWGCPGRQQQANRRIADMVFPIGDDNSDMRTVPAVNYVLIALNVLVFVVFQGLGTNDTFTYKYATVPKEIATGKDIVTNDRVIEDPISGRTFQRPGYSRPRARFTSRC